MNMDFSFVRQKGKQYSVVGFIFSLLLFALACLLTWWRWPLAFVVSGLAMVVHLVLSFVNIWNSSREKTQKLVNCWVAVVGCTILYLYNLLSIEGKPFTISGYLEEFDTVDKIFHAVVILIYFVCMLGLWSSRRFSLKRCRNERRNGVIMEGPNGKQYLMPGNAATAWEIYRMDLDLDFSKDRIPEYLLSNRIADLMYEDFKESPSCILHFKPDNHYSDEQWKKEDRSAKWANYAYIMHDETARFWEKNGQYQKAKEYVDRLTEIYFQRGSGASFIDGISLADVREKVYRHFPESARDRAVELRCAQLAKQAQVERAAREEDLRRYEADAPKRAEERRKRMAEERLEEEERRLQQQMRAEKRAEQEQKLRTQYDAKMKNLDDRERVVNALLDKNTYTDEEN